MHQQALTRASHAEAQIKVETLQCYNTRPEALLCKPHLAFSCWLQLLERKLQEESQLQKTVQRANLEGAAAAQQQTALKQHVIQ